MGIYDDVTVDILESKMDTLADFLASAAKRYKGILQELDFINSFEESASDDDWRPTLENGERGKSRCEVISEMGETYGEIKGLCIGADCLLAGYDNYGAEIGTCMRRLWDYYGDFDRKATPPPYSLKEAILRGEEDC